MKFLAIKVGSVSDNFIEVVKRKIAFNGVDYYLDNLENNFDDLTEVLLDFSEEHTEICFWSSQDEFLNLSLVEILGIPVLFIINEAVSLGLKNRIQNWQKYAFVAGVAFEKEELAQNFSIKIPWLFVENGTKSGRFFTGIGEKYTPSKFKRRLFRLAQQNLKTIILPEGEETRVQLAALTCVEKKVARCVLLGNPDKILTKLGEHPNLIVLDPDKLWHKYVTLLYELRKNKGMSMVEAEQQLQKDRTLLATLMLYEGKVDGLVSGAVHTTADTIRPALQIIKTKPDSKLVSSIFLICLADRVMVFGDCAINLNPTAEELIEIAYQSSRTAKNFGLEPKVALLSYATIDSAKGPDVELVSKAANLAKQTYPSLEIEGPLQFDAAFDPGVAELKIPNNHVAGHANLFIFPNLTAGNIGYKIAQRCGNLLAIGPILQGLKKPVNDLSRGCTVEDIIYTVVVTAIQAQN